MSLIPAILLLLTGCGPDCEGGQDARLWHADVDGDGHGDPNATLEACEQPWAYVSNSDDCDDRDPDRAPGQLDLCNAVDDDCDGQIDEDGVDEQLFLDVDGDGYGSRVSWTGCGPPPNPLYRALRDDDCDDTDIRRHPRASERCNGIDDDCDGDIDEGAIDQTLQHVDDDGDGFGDTFAAIVACPGEPGASPDGGDCDDGAPDVYPGALERCNGIDDDCDGYEDELPVDGALFYVDLDEDGWGSTVTVPACSVGEAYVPFSDVYGYFFDGPSFTYQYYYYYRSPLVQVPVVATGGDCSAFDSGTHPGALERCDGFDNNCSGLIDDDDPALAQALATRYHIDVDGDGFGRDTLYTYACSAPFNYVTANGDCNDDRTDVNPSELENCNDGLDNDCNGLIDDSDPNALGCP